MTDKKRCPREAGNGRKLAGWAHRHSTLLQWLPALLSLAPVGALVAYVVFGGAR